MKNLKKRTLGVLALIASAFVTCAQNLLASGLVAAANTYDSALMVHDRSVTRTNDAAVTARHLLWKKGSADTGLAVCGVADIPLGTVDNVESETDKVQELLLLGKGPTKKVVASEAITVGEEVFTAASGKVQDRPSGSGTYWFIGIALTAAGADGDIIEINDCAPVKLVIA